MSTSSKMFPYMDNFACKTLSRRLCRAISSLFFVFILIYYLRGCNSLILLSGDIKTNPGPTPSSWQCFSICHWNLSSNAAHNLAKLSLLTAYNLVLSFDIICLSDTYLNFITPPNDTHLELPRYICSVLITLLIIKRR